jgi:transglutaminase-like putative cysteine protease
MIRVLLVLLAISLPAAGPRCGQVAAEQAAAKSRTFQLDYEAAFTDLSPGKRIRIWLPVPRSNEQQRVRLLRRKLPVEASVDVEPQYGNRIMYLELEVPRGGRIPLELVYRVTRREMRGLADADGRSAEKLSERERELFLRANALVPLDGKPLELLRDRELPTGPLELARVLYDRVDEHMKYDKSRPGYGRGDAVWACDSRYGNCTDFHSLFISLARSRRLPARFEIGFPLPVERGGGEIGGYHCWGLVYVDEIGWVPVDISEADKNPEMKDYYFGNLTADRVAFSTGRDLTLAPRQAGPPLNFFVSPYAEVDGKPLGSERIDLRVRYRDL